VRFVLNPSVDKLYKIQPDILMELMKAYESYVGRNQLSCAWSKLR